MVRQLLGWLAVVVQLLLIAAILLVAWRSPAGPWWAIAAGCVAGALGLLIAARALKDLGDALSASPVPNQRGLRTDGLYRHVRHPIYSGLILATLGVLLIRPSWLCLLCWLGLVALLAMKAVWEERMLAELFPEYDNYRQRTGGFLPKGR